eukprot:GAHX01000151.1.p1 GENE.GAHX01000151.1~~GAHX01000151.1.p1  ORF type:complete len:233 (-),score=45.11 GAHX01000151.1:33-731(-)
MSPQTAYKESVQPQDVFKIRANSPRSQQRDLIIKRLRVRPMLTLSALGTSTDVLVQIVNDLVNTRKARLISLHTSMARSMNLNRPAELAQITAKIIVNIDPKLMKLRNFDVIFRNTFLPNLLKKYPNYETEETLDKDKKINMLVPLSDVLDIEFPDDIDEKDRDTAAEWLTNFEKAQKTPQQKTRGTFIDKTNNRKGYMNKYEFLAFLSRVLRKAINIDGVNLKELLEKIYG